MIDLGNNADTEQAAIDALSNHDRTWGAKVNGFLKKQLKSTTNAFGSAATKATGSSAGDVPVVGSTEGKVPVLGSNNRFASSIVPAVASLIKATIANIQGATGGATAYVAPVEYIGSRRAPTSWASVSNIPSAIRIYGSSGLSSITDVSTGVIECTLTNNRETGSSSTVAEMSRSGQAISGGQSSRQGISFFPYSGSKSGTSPSGDQSFGTTSAQKGRYGCINHWDFSLTDGIYELVQFVKQVTS